MTDTKEDESWQLSRSWATLQQFWTESGREIVLRWEYLRIFYNLSMLMVVQVVAGPELGQWLVDPRKLTEVIFCCLGANVLFCAGHCVELCLALLRLRTKVISYVLFAAGTAFAMLLSYLFAVIISDGFSF